MSEKLKPIRSSLMGNKTSAARIQLVGVAVLLASKGDFENSTRIYRVVNDLLQAKDRKGTRINRRPAPEEVDTVFREFAKGSSRAKIEAATGLPDTTITRVLCGAYGMPSHLVRGDKNV